MTLHSFPKSRPALLSRRRQRYARLALEALEPRVLLSATFGNADMQGLWTYAATDQAGSISFDNINHISAGSLTDANNATHAPSGTYTISSAGAISITDVNTRGGAMNSSRDVIAATQNNLDNTLSILVSGGNTTFSNADLNGTWNLEFNGPTPQSNGSGNLTFDGNGHITDGSLSTDGSISGGTYTVNSDGTCTLSIDFNSQSGSQTITYTGALNASKDFLALDPNLQSAAANTSPNLTVLVRSKGIYSNADVKGVWTLETEGGFATLTLDGTGHIANTTFTNWDGTTFPVSGTYSVAASGSYSGNVTATQNGVTQRMLQTGFINASRNIMIQNQPGTTHSSNLSVLISSNAHNPTLSSVVPFFIAVAGQPFSISFDQLAGHSDASVSNGQPLQFQITGVASGALTNDGSPVTTFPTAVVSGDVLAWTSSATASGAIAAFTIKAFDGTTLSTTAAANVTINTIIPGPFSNSNLNNLWNLESTSSAGSVIFDGGGSIIGGSITDNSGGTYTPSGTYTVSPTGAVTVSSGGTKIGALNASHDVAALTSSDGLKVLINNQNANVAASDLAGLWTVAANGDTIDSNGVGNITLDANGNITSGTFTSGTGSQSVTGRYTLNGGADLTLNIVSHQSNGQAHTITLTGFINNAKDVMALTPPDLLAAKNHSDSNLVLLVHGTGSFSNADAKGVWTIASNGSTGAVTLDGAGHILNGFINDNGKFRTLGGTYTVTASGAWTLNAVVNKNGVSQTQVFKGALNKSRNTIIMNTITNDSENTANLIVLINSADHAPTLSTVAPLATAISGQPFAIAFADLQAAANESDLDHDSLAFKIISLAPGSALSLNGTAVTTFPTTFSNGDSLVWTPAATSSGNIAAFTIKATDGTLASATAIPVTIKTVLTPTISIAATKANASEIKGSTAGMGVFTLTRAKGILTSDLTVTVTIAGTAANGTDYSHLDTEVHFAANQTTAKVSLIPLTDALAEGTETAIMTVVASDTGAIYNVSPTKNTATIKIADAASTISIAATKPAASEINGTTSGKGVFTFTRTGGDMSIPLTVNFSVAGTAAETTEYTTLSSHTVTFAANKSTAIVTINPIDDIITEGPKTVILAPTADPSYFITNNTRNTSATVTIADDLRPLIAGPVNTLGDAHVATPFIITYANLLAATHAQARSGAITFKITKVFTGTLQKNGSPVVINSTIVSSGDTLNFTGVIPGTLSAFNVTAVNGTNLSATLTIPIHVIA